ncbi:MAG TPA: phospholipase D-like domain-containing protein [Vicinamibacterales bacterium]|nr:phospholipase D-like domain-containing protein [Vicinamibacterales bacterium]
MKLIIEPDDGVTPVVQAIKKAKRTIQIVIFRFDRLEVQKALEAAVARGVDVQALIAHTNKGGEKTLRKLELQLLASGLTVSRTADDLPRYHGKMMLIDNEALHVYGFNYTKLDIDKSRSFGIVTRDRKLVAEGMRLFEADFTRQTYTPGHSRFVVSPENSRSSLTQFVKEARKQLLIYDQQVSDNLLQRVLLERAKSGVEIRIIGRLEKSLPGVKTRKLADMRLHVRAIVRDGASAFVGSQSLRKLELDGRREVGVIVNDTGIARKIAAVFEADWRAGALVKKAS